jgi:hypothetical protein
MPWYPDNRPWIERTPQDSGYPIHPSTYVEVLLRVEREMQHYTPSKLSVNAYAVANWTLDDSPTDIVAWLQVGPDLMGNSFQHECGVWYAACLPASSIEERCDRFIEEAFELVQSLCYDSRRILALRDYVYSRPQGTPHQELGGVMLTLATLANRVGLDMTQAGNDELVEAWKHIDKPTGAALPTTSDFTFEVGERVTKITSSNQGKGTIVARYYDLWNRPCYVVELDFMGFQMVARPTELDK